MIFTPLREGAYVNHNSDWSGDAFLHWNQTSGAEPMTRKSVVVPGWLVRDLARAQARDDLVAEVSKFLDDLSSTRMGRVGDSYP